MRRAAISTVGVGVLTQAVLVVSGVLVARMLGVADRGQFALLALIPSILMQLGAVGLPVAATYEIAKAPAAARLVAQRLVRPFAVQSIALTALHGLILVFLLHGQPERVVIAGLMTLPLVPAQLASQYGLAVLQGLHRYKPFNVVRLLPNLVYSLLLAACFVVGLEDIRLVMLIWLVGYSAAGVLGPVLARRALPSTSVADAPTSAHMFRFGARAFLGSVSPLDAFKVDQALVGLLLSPVALGYYVVGVAFTNLPRFVAQSAGMVAYPHIAHTADASTARRQVWLYFGLTTAACAALCAALAASVSWIIPPVFGREFAGAIEISRLLLLGVFFVCARRILSDCSRGAGYPQHGTLAEIVAWITLAPAVLLLLPGGDARGVALAVAISSAASFVFLLVAVVRAGRSTPVPSDLKPVAT